MRRYTVLVKEPREGEWRDLNIVQFYPGTPLGEEDWRTGATIEQVEEIPEPLVQTFMVKVTTPLDYPVQGPVTEAYFHAGLRSHMQHGGHERLIEIKETTKT